MSVCAVGQAIRTENISSYMRDIKQIPLIDRKREAELSVKVHSSDENQVLDARNELVCSNLRLVVKIAHDFKQYRLPFDDLVAEGNIGLIRAAEKFDPEKGAKFSCYAAWWIKQAMRKAIANQTRTIRVPGQCAQKLIHLDKARRQFFSEHQRQPTIEELAAMTGYSEKSVLGLSRAATETYSIDDVVRTDSDTTFGEMLPEESEDQHKEAADEEQIMHMRRLLLNLSDREQTVITYKFGLNGQTLEDSVICQETGLTRKQLALYVVRTLRKLRSMLNEDTDN
jgi:RNA polymerase primary sigma factor